MNISKHSRENDDSFRPSLETPQKKLKDVFDDLITQPKVKKALFFTPMIAKMKKESIMTTPVKAKVQVKAYNYEDLDKTMHMKDLRLKKVEMQL